MKLFNNMKSSATGFALVALVSASTAFLESTPAVAKGVVKPQPAVLSASAIAVADSGGATTVGAAAGAVAAKVTLSMPTP